MARHTAETIMEILADNPFATSFQISEILEKPEYQVRKILSKITAKTDSKNKKEVKNK